MSDSAKLQAFADLQFLSQRLRGIVSLGDDLKNVASLEQAGDEAQARLDKIKAEAVQTESAIEAKRSAFNDELADAKRSAEAMLRELQDEGGRALADAEEKAGKIIAAAEQSGAKIVADANREVKEKGRAIASSKETLGAIGSQINDARATLDAINAEITTGTARRDAIASEIAALKARL